jgi:CP family cyanate transporter-like MFS transporter
LTQASAIPLAENSKIPGKRLAVAVFLTFSILANLFAVPPMETILTKSLSISHFQSGLLFSGPIIMLALTAIPAGIIADRIGIKKAIGIGGILLFIGTILRGTATNYTILLVFSLIFGLGLGWSFALLPKLARTWSPPRQTLIVMGIINAGGVMCGIGTALAITVPLIYRITNSYHSVFYIWSIPIFIATVLWWTTISDTPGQTVKVGPEETRVTLPRAFLKNKILWLLAFLLFLHNFVFYTWSGWLPTYLLGRGVSIDSAGLMTSIMLWVGVPTVILIPLLSFGSNVPRKLFVWLPSIAFIFLTSGILFAPQWLVWVIIGLSGMMNVLRFNTLLVLPVELVPRERAGMASGIAMAIGYIGAVVGPAVGGNILDVSGNFQIVFGTLTVISLVSTFFAFLIPRMNPKIA